MNAKQQASTSATIGASTTNYGCVGTSSTTMSATEASRAVIYRTAGVISRLVCVKSAGDRTGMQVDISRNAGTDVGGCSIAFSSVNGEYEDTTGTNTITAGNTVSLKAQGGSGGTTSLGITWGCLWSATGTTTTHFVTGNLLYSVASETSYRQPCGGAQKTTTQAEGEWLVKLPAGVDHVTLKNLWVYKTNTNTQTNPITVSVNGATGTGTAPTVTIGAADNTARAYEDTTNSIQAKDGDKISIKVVTGAGTVNFSPFFSLEVQSDDGVFHLVLGLATGVAFNNTKFQSPGGVLSNGNATESQVQTKIGILGIISHLSAYVKTGGTGSTISLRANAASVGSPATEQIATTATGWVTDSTNKYRCVATDEITVGAAGSADATPTCICMTVTALTAVSASDTGSGADASSLTASELGAETGVGSEITSQTLVPVGTSTVGSTDDTQNINAKTVNLVTAVGGPVFRAQGYLNGNGGSQAFRVVVYSDSAGSPGTLLGYSDEVVVSGSGYAWKVFPFSTHLYLAAGQQVWIGYIAGPFVAPQPLMKEIAGSFKYQNSNLDTYSDGPASTFGTISGTAAFTLCLYLEVDIASGVLVSESSSDSGSGVDASSLSPASFTGADTGAGSDASSISAKPISADTGSGADGTSLAAKETATGETGTGADASVEKASLGATGDTGTGTDSGISLVPISVSESGVGVDVQVNLLAKIVAQEANSSNESGLIIARVNSSDSGSGVNTAITTALFVSNDTGIAVDSQAMLAVHFVLTESHVAVDEISKLALVASETGLGVDTPILKAVYAVSESGHGVDSIQSLATRLQANDTGGLYQENATLHALQVVADLISGIDIATVKTRLFGSDSGSSVDAGSMSAFIVVSDEIQSAIETLILAIETDGDGENLILSTYQGDAVLLSVAGDKPILISTKEESDGLSTA